MTAPPKPIELEEAWERLLGPVEALPAETFPVEACLGRYLAEDLIARRTQPPCDLSAMDGYAVRVDDLVGPWTVIGESAAGHPFAGELSRGEAIRISTGAHMPSGEMALLLQENAAREADALSLNVEGDPTPRHIRRAGHDFAEGQALLSRGVPIGAAQIALALGAGHAKLAVHALPSLAIIDSGDELVSDPESCAPHQIPATNGAMLVAMAAPHCRKIVRLGPVADSLNDLLNALDQASEADVIVTSGGASVGDHDLVKPALEQWGAEIDFWRVAIKPGKPLMVGRKGTQIILGLPGNPGSAYVTAFLFLLPLLRRIAGSGQPLPKAVSATAGCDIGQGGQRREFLRSEYSGGVAHPFGSQDSGGLLSLASANALVERPANAVAVANGEGVPVYIL